MTQIFPKKRFFVFWEVFFLLWAAANWQHTAFVGIRRFFERF
jgi:hypothetical protein